MWASVALGRRSYELAVLIVRSTEIFQDKKDSTLTTNLWYARHWVARDNYVVVVWGIRIAQGKWSIFLWCSVPCSVSFFSSVYVYGEHAFMYACKIMGSRGHVNECMWRPEPNVICHFAGPILFIEEGAQGHGYSRYCWNYRWVSMPMKHLHKNSSSNLLVIGQVL